MLLQFRGQLLRVIALTMLAFENSFTRHATYTAPAYRLR